MEPEEPLNLAKQGSSVSVLTGAAHFLIAPGPRSPIANVVVAGEPVLDCEKSGFSAEDGDGRPCNISFRTVTIEEQGPLRAVALAVGAVELGGGKRLELEVRLHFVAASATIKVSVTVRNPDPATHQGGYWELGDPGSAYLKDFSFAFVLPSDASSTQAFCSEDCESPFQPIGLPFELYQESSGGVQWQHPNHQNRDGTAPLRFRGYRVHSGATDRFGLRATPVVGIRRARTVLAVSCPRFWQDFPKAMEATPDRITLRLFPRQFGGLHELQGGEQKTHHFHVALADDPITGIPLHWSRAPLHVSLPPAWYCESGAVPHMLPREVDPVALHHELVDVAIDPQDGFAARRETIDEYGWRNFGDLYADHEAVFNPDSVRVSHYNNQYDAIAGFAMQFMRTGDVRWWVLMDDLARHVSDVDIYHTDGDKAAYNHGLFWHTAHYVDAGRSTHRSYPRSPGVAGGGLSNEHNYAGGLLLHHYLTGDPISAQSAAGLARWVTAMDDGRRTVFRWLSRTSTGLATQTFSTDYHGPGRGAGHSLLALLVGLQLSGDTTFLEKSEEIIRRVVHPRDDIASRNLLDAERRWSYTAFLQALGQYLMVKSERGEFDRMYAYARASLLHYARWMAVNEYPYLDMPDRLEFPTETWAAQDLRKSDVFYLAASVADGDERARFVQRGAYFAEHALQTLAAMPTRRLTRPVVLMLSHGWLHHIWEAGWEGPQPHVDLPAYDEEPARPFVPQRATAIRRASGLAIGVAVGVLAALGWWFIEYID